MAKFKPKYGGERKYSTRDELFFHLKGTQVHGLAGPDILNYVSFLNDRGFSNENIFIYENDSRIADLQQHKLLFPEMQGVNWKYADIFTAPVQDNCIYDIDSMLQMGSIEHLVRKFKTNFMFTVTTRGMSLSKSKELFFKWRKEEILLEVPSLISKKRGDIIKTNLGSYRVMRYRDTCPMMSIIQMP